jgi:rhodanese-related sulfurtransferase
MPIPEFHELVSEAKKEIHEINVSDLKTMQQGGEDFSLIDVRDSRGTLEHNIDQVTTDKNRKIVLYCGGGSRSALSAASLKKMGFKNVISLAGGYKSWKESGT